MARNTQGECLALALGAVAVLTLGCRQDDLSSDVRLQKIIENAVRNERPFVFVLVLSPRIDSGNPLPAGALEIDLTPVLTVGL